MKKKILPIFILLISLALVGVGIAYAYLSSPVDKNSTEEIQIEIKPGYTSRKIAEVLEEKGLIRNKYVFLLELKIYKLNFVFLKNTYFFYLFLTKFHLK